MKTRHEQFIAEYVKDWNARAAAIRVGYDENSAAAAGKALLERPEVQARIAQERADIAQRNRVTVDWLIAELRREIDTARTKKKRVYYKGDLVDEYECPDQVIVLRALEMLGNSIGAWRQTLELSGPGGSAIPLNLSPAEKSEKIQKLLEVINDDDPK